MGLAEQLGRILSCLNDGLPDTLEIEYQGGLAGAGTGILTLSVLKGLFAAGTDGAGELRERPPAGRRARPRGAGDLDGHRPRLRQPDHPAQRRPLGGRHPHRPPDRAPPGDDGRPHGRGAPGPPHGGGAQRRPGRDDRGGRAPSSARPQVSISSMAVGPSATGNTALMVLSTDRQVPDDALAGCAAPRASATCTPSSPRSARPVMADSRRARGPAVRRGPGGDRVPVPPATRGRVRLPGGWPRRWRRRPGPCRASSTSRPSPPTTGSRCRWSPSPPRAAHRAWRDDPAPPAGPAAGPRRVLPRVLDPGGGVHPRLPVEWPGAGMGSTRHVPRAPPGPPRPGSRSSARRPAAGSRRRRLEHRRATR